MNSKRVTLIGSVDAGEKNDISSLRQELSASSDIEYKLVYWEDLVFDISLDGQRIIDSRTGQDLADTDHLIAMNWYKSGKQKMYREVAYSLALYLQSKKITFWNEEMAAQRSTSKLSSTMLLALMGHDVPHTYYSLDSKKLLKSQEQNFPVIVKAAQASRGRDNYLVKDNNKLQEILNKSDAVNPYLIQEFIPNDSDVRIICVDSSPALAIKRQRTNDETHLNNTSQGAEASLVDINKISPDIIQACSTICATMKRNIAGIDLIVASDSNRTVFLEVNSIPQLTSGVFIDQKAQAISEKLKDALERNDT